MANEIPRRAVDVSTAYYERIKEQTSTGRPVGRSAGAIAVLLFAIAAVVLILAMEFGADLQQILLGIFVIGAVNLVLALIGAATAKRV